MVDCHPYIYIIIIIISIICISKDSHHSNYSDLSIIAIPITIARIVIDQNQYHNNEMTTHDYHSKCIYYCNYGFIAICHQAIFK